MAGGRARPELLLFLRERGEGGGGEEGREREREGERRRRSSERQGAALLRAPTGLSFEVAGIGIA